MQPVKPVQILKNVMAAAGPELCTTAIASKKLILIAVKEKNMLKDRKLLKVK